MGWLYFFLIFLLSNATFFGFLLYAFRLSGRLIGGSIRSRTQQRRELLFQRAAEEEKEQQSRTPAKSSSSTSLDEEWEKVNQDEATSPGTQGIDKSYSGVIGFFHPFCNAGGGGERVLFAAIQATQQRYPDALCVVYTGDHDVSKQQILTNVRNRFNIKLNSARVAFLYLSTREWVLASQWPHFTLLGQSMGSLIVGWDAVNLLAPDIFIDTMGYAFVLALCKWLFPSMPTGAYVHYPTISTDMLDSLHDEVSAGAPGSADRNASAAEKGLNAGSGKGVRGQLKQRYWQLFAKLYSWVGGHVDVVMTNSTWTQRHISSLWGSARTKRKKKWPVSIVYPPCAVSELREGIPLDTTSENQRTRNLLYIAQFRPEKMHHLIIDAFATFLKTTAASPRPGEKPKLILIGSVRDDHDEKLVYKLRLQAHEIRDNVQFLINARWQEILEQLKSCSVGVNAMWNEHFGIGVVEYQAAGLISVVNDSGGPKEDIVVPIDGGETGFHASTGEEYAEAFGKALSLGPEDALAMRRRARKSSERFSEEVFGRGWVDGVVRLVELGREV